MLLQELVQGFTHISEVVKVGEIPHHLPMHFEGTALVDLLGTLNDLTKNSMYRQSSVKTNNIQ